MAAMTGEQVVAYAQELQFNSSDSLTESLGGTMNEACYQVGYTLRASHAIGRLNRRRGESPELDRLIDTVISKIRGDQ